MESRVAAVRASNHAARRKSLTRIKVASTHAMHADEAGFATVEDSIDKPRQGEAKLPE